MIPPSTPFADFLRARLEARFADCDQKPLEYLHSKGISVTRAALGHWLNGIRVPSRGRMELLLDALDVYGDDRLHAYRLAAGVEADDPEDDA